MNKAPPPDPPCKFQLEHLTREMLVQRLAKPAYKHFEARICRQIPAEHLNFFKV